MKHIFLILLLLSNSTPLALKAQNEMPAGAVYERVVRLTGTDEGDLTLFLKLPPQATRGSQVDGVLAFCTWDNEARYIRNILNGRWKDPEGFRARLVNYAAQNNLAVVTWTNYAKRKAIDKRRGIEELPPQEAVKTVRAFDPVSQGWRRGIQELIREHTLPDRQWLLYGMSRGAQWAQQVALREPDLFAAVHLHINSFYEAPNQSAARLRWLVTTGELDSGYPAAKRFFESARELNYPIIFYVHPKLDHKNHPAVERLSTAFFDFNIKQLRALAAGQSPQSEDRFVGNYFTQEYVPWANGARVPAPYRVILPSSTIAEAWGLKED
jgi:hypothetical protein